MPAAACSVSIPSPAIFRCIAAMCSPIRSRAAAVMAIRSGAIPRASRATLTTVWSRRTGRRRATALSCATRVVDGEATAHGGARSARNALAGSRRSRIRRKAAAMLPSAHALKTANASVASAAPISGRRAKIGSRGARAASCRRKPADPISRCMRSWNCGNLLAPNAERCWKWKSPGKGMSRWRRLFWTPRRAPASVLHVAAGRSATRAAPRAKTRHL